MKVAATAEAEQIVVRAQELAATIDERARQEFAWRRRQMRHEQDLLTRRKQAMLSQLTSLSALAVETAENLPEVPELQLSDLSDLTDEQVEFTEPAEVESEAADRPADDRELEPPPAR